MKTHEKKKAWRRACRAQVKAGMGNAPDGTWKTRQQLGAQVEDSGMEMYQAGHHLGKGRKRD